MRLDADMRRTIREQSLAFVATVCPDGTPNLSPKGSTIVWDDEHLLFLHLHSPGTVANLRVNPAIEINVVDPILRKGYRFKGHAEVLTDGEIHAEVVEYFRRERGRAPEQVGAVVLMTVVAAAPLVSPVYDEASVTESEVVQRWRDHHLALASSRLATAADGARARE